MTPQAAATPEDRRSLLVEAIVAHRKAGEGEVTLAWGDRRVDYADRLVRLALENAERDRLEALLAAFPVFKVKQPETRKAPDDVVYVSAIADPKHAADFIEGAFRDVYGAPTDYELRVAE